MNLKPGVSLVGMEPQLVVAMLISLRVVEDAMLSFTVTSCNDGQHRDGSYHYAGRAFDLRTRSWIAGGAPMTDALKTAMAAKVQGQLGPEFRVAFEPTNAQGRTEHIHIEWRGPAPKPVII